MQSKILKIADSLAKKHKEKEALLYYNKVIPFLTNEILVVEIIFKFANFNK